VSGTGLDRRDEPSSEGLRVRTLRPTACDARVQLDGELDLASLGLLEAEVLAALRAGASRVLLDLHGVRFVDAAGLGGIVRAVNHAEAAGSRLSIVEPSPAVRRVLRLTNLEGLTTQGEP
jgi:anti-anti-sigma factor